MSLIPSENPHMAVTSPDGLTPHDAGLDASASRQRCLPSQPVGRVPASRRPPLAVLLDAPRRMALGEEREFDNQPGKKRGEDRAERAERS